MATPIVPVLKPDGRVRLCGDYKITVNPAIDVEQHPLPKPQELLATLLGGQRFTKLDLSAVYQQMLLEEESRKLVTIDTHLGLFRYCRLPFGIVLAPAIFQRAMDTLLQDIPHVICYIDDVLVTGLTEEEHLQNLTQVLHKLQEQWKRLKKENPKGSGVFGILQAPAPRNVRVTSFLWIAKWEIHTQPIYNDSPPEFIVGARLQVELDTRMCQRLQSSKAISQLRFGFSAF